MASGPKILPSLLHDLLQVWFSKTYGGKYKLSISSCFIESKIFSLSISDLCLKFKNTQNGFVFFYEVVILSADCFAFVFC